MKLLVWVAGALGALTVARAVAARWRPPRKVDRAFRVDIEVTLAGKPSKPACPKDREGEGGFPAFSVDRGFPWAQEARLTLLTLVGSVLGVGIQWIVGGDTYGTTSLLWASVFCVAIPAAFFAARWLVRTHGDTGPLDTAVLLMLWSMVTLALLYLLTSDSESWHHVPFSAFLALIPFILAANRRLSTLSSWITNRLLLRNQR